MKQIIADDEMSTASNMQYASMYFFHRVRSLEAALEEIEKVALVSEGVEFYAMVARKGLDGEFDYDGYSEP
jgi:hypothetical protein